jgi:pimeloyl-ACP methyl ester carboxylesterase
MRTSTVIACGLFFGPLALIVPPSLIAATLALADCRIESAAGGGSIAARCGTLHVPENREQPNGRQVHLRVAVVPALRLKSEPDPLFVLSGGPGQAATDFYVMTSGAFGRIRRDRDIVLVDQRGTGQSNRLDCSYPDDADFAAAGPQLLETETRKCLASLPGDPRYYTTSVAVRDLDDVRAALGYDRVNLYGVSYGTRVAQHYIRRYPVRVRSAVLDGVVPPELGLGPDVAIEAQHALDTVFERCNGDTACRTAFPDIATTFDTLRLKLRAKPATVSINDPVDAKPTNAPFAEANLAAAVRLLSYSDETASILPLLIHDAQVSERPQAMAAQYLMIKRSTDTQIAYGMHFAVVCSEDAPRFAATGITDEALAKTYMGDSFMVGLRTICAVWPHGVVDEDFGAPLTSDVPALILSGGNDPVTPQHYGERVARSFPNGKHLIVEGQGHGQIGNGCMPLVVADFIAGASVQKLAVGCIAEISPTPFMLSPSAPAP